MSGSATPPPDSPAETGGADPSMEDILASIRRILNEDEVAPGSPAGSDAHATVEPVGAPDAGDDGVLVLDEAMLVPVPIPEHIPPPVEPPPSPPPPVPEPVRQPAAAVEVHDGLMGQESADAAAASVGTLLRQLSSERATQVYRGGPTIEDLVREEVRPLLKAWLDEHLPPLVERLVRQEIERVAGRANL